MKYTLSAVVLGTCLSMNAAHAGTQCVLNKAGYTAEVHWYLGSDIKVTQESSTKAVASLNAGASAYRTKSLTSGKESCETHDGDLFATIRVVGGKDARLATQIGAGILIGVGAATVCTLTAEAACAAAVEAVPELEYSPSLIPKAAGYFYGGVPHDIGSSEHRLILSGSVWDPKAEWKKK